MHRTPKSRRARRQAGSLALATLLVISTACTSSKADGAKATASHPTTTAAIKLDQAYKKHTVAWVSTLAIGTSILIRDLWKSAPDPAVDLGKKVQAESLDWSPDGKSIAFDSNRDSSTAAPAANGLYHIWVLRRGSKTPVQLTKDTGSDGWPVWSPDGSKIAFFSNKGGKNFDLWVMDADGGNQRQLTHLNYPVSQIVWSPDGTHLAFSLETGLQGAVFQVALDGSKPVVLAQDPGLNISPSYSPDGKQIAYTGRVGKDKWSHIYVMDVDGSHKRKLTDTKYADTMPTWSPDGKRIAFLRNMLTPDNDIRQALWTMNADGTGALNLTPSDVHNQREASWSSDSRFLIFTSLSDVDQEVDIAMAGAPAGFAVSAGQRAQDSWGAWSPITKDESSKG
jgi:Tol biopolymer transport system component